MNPERDGWRLEHGLGYKRDRHDPRDYHVGVTYRFASKRVLPDTFELPGFSNIPVKNQGKIGACVGYSTSTAKAYFDTLERGKLQILSANMIYAEGRIMEGTFPQDAGMEIRNANKLIADKGVPQESLWPSTESQFNVLHETPEMWADALKQKIASYARLSTVADIKQALTQGSPVVIGLPVYTSWPMVTLSGDVPIPRPGEQILGGHAITIYGFTNPLLKFRNSWGGLWGRGGNGTFVGSWIDSVLQNGMGDAWSWVDVVANPTPPPPPVPPPIPPPPPVDNSYITISFGKTILGQVTPISGRNLYRLKYKKSFWSWPTLSEFGIDA